MRKEKTKSIKTKVLGLTITSVLILSAILLGVMIYSIYHVEAQSSDIAQDSLLKQVKNSIQYNIQAIVQNSSVQYDKEKNSMPEKDAVDKILDNIRNTKYSESGYYFVYTYEGIRLVAPENKAQEGKNLWDLTDEKGNKPVQEFVKQAKAGGGFVTYMWMNPSTNTVEEKISYIAPLKMGNTEVVVGTGTYLPMIEEVKQQMDSAQQNTISTLLGVAIPGVVVLAALILFVMYGFLSKRVIKPIREVTDTAISLAKGDTDVALDIKSKDEIGKLAATVNGEVRQAFKDIVQARIISEKQASYQSSEVGKLLVNLQRLARGELFCDIVVDKADQDTESLYQLFSEIASNLSSGVSAIKDYISEISDVLSEMANGNMCVNITSDYKGDFITLKQSINMIAESLNSTLSEINNAASQVASGTSQVSSGSQTISQGATEQTSSIEELSASITQIAAQTKQNAENANAANQLALNAQSEATSGNDHMKEMQEAMNQINESSQNISKIIKVIDDIAFQTNILALNAAVEAARAGIHGKGFAVVAEEVRNLAARSANAANETTELIEGSIKKVEAGTKIANQTAEALYNIVTGVEKVAELVGQIASASNEQATGISQVDRGIEQLSQVVQTNSATAEEAAAASEELSSQADLLKTMVTQFKLQATAKMLDESKRTPVLKQGHGSAEINLSDQEYGKY